VQLHFFDVAAPQSAVLLVVIGNAMLGGVALLASALGFFCCLFFAVLYIANRVLHHVPVEFTF